MPRSPRLRARRREELLTGEENTIFADAGYRGAERRTRTQAALYIVMRPGKRRALMESAKDRVTDSLDRKQ